jgi:hypothetical protein
MWLQNGTERGFVLKGVEEINLLLEDMGLNLQSMMASPHVRPFAEEVRNWEQRLSLIGEAVEVGVCQHACTVSAHIVCLHCACVAHYGWDVCQLWQEQIPSTRLWLLLLAGVDASAAQVDVPGKHLHWQ